MYNLAQNWRSMWWLLLLFPVLLKAYHIAGADFTYRYEGNNRYRLELTIYRDCSRDGQPNVADFDDPLYLFVYESSSKALVNILTVSKPRYTPKLQPDVENCMVGVPPVCIEVGRYVAYVTLPPIPGGYDVVWQRCCRNSNIVNLANPIYQGATFMVHIPGTESYPVNSSPVFRQRPPLFICRGATLTFDHSATDPDGDSLVYVIRPATSSLDYNNLGATYNFPMPTPSNPPPPPPYRPVTYAPSYSAQQPFGPNGIFQIDPKTGILTINAPNLGLYTVAISVLEYRNGVLLSEVKRDMQFLVVDCLPIGPPPQITHQFPPDVEVKGDTVVLYVKDSACYTVIAYDTSLKGNLTYSLGFSVVSPVYNVFIYGNNPLYMDVCVQGDCNFIDQTIMLPVQVWDDGECYGYNNAFDTVWLQIKPVSNPPPSLNVTLDSIRFLSTTPVPLLYNGDEGCFYFTVRDSAPRYGPLQYQLTLYDRFWQPVTPSNQATITILSNQNDTLIQGRFCWKENCEFPDDSAYLVFSVLDYGGCALDNIAKDTIPLAFLLKDSEPVVLYYDSLSLPFNNDTLSIRVKQPVCVPLYFIDSLNQGHLTLIGDGPLFDGIPPDGQILQTQGQTILTTQFCFYPSCVAYDTTFEVRIYGISQPECKKAVFDTTMFYIHVYNPPNRPPQLRRSIPSPSDVTVAEPLCYYVEVTDPDDILAFQLINFSYAFNDTFGYGSNGKITSIDTLAPNHYRIHICITPNCYVNDQEILLRFCLEDTTTCDTLTPLCDALRLNVSDCGLVMPNVFTPNGDGINEFFGPKILEGIQRYEMAIYDRWGRLLYRGTTPWKPDESVPEGVYFYQIRFWFHNGNGPEWVREQYGSFSLIR